MKKTLLYVIYSLFLLLIRQVSFGQTFSVKYDFASVTSGSGPVDQTPAPTIPSGAVVFGQFVAVGTNPTTANAAGRFSFQGWPLGATSGSDVFTGTISTTEYYEVTLTPATLTALTLTNLTFTLQRSATGVRQCSVRSSVDNFAANLPASLSAGTAVLSVVPTNIIQSTAANTSATDGPTIIFDASSFSNLATPVTLRFYGFNAQATTGTFSIDNVVINGSTSAVAATPLLTVAPTALDFGTTQAVGTTSTAQTFTVLGANLTAGATLTATGPFTISTDGGTTYGTTATIAQGSLATAQTVNVRFTPVNATAATGTVSIASTGATTQTVTLTGTGAIAPILLVNPTTLAFGNVNAGLTSIKTFAITGSNLGTSTTTLTATGVYTISKDATTYGTTLTLSATEIAANPTISVKFSPVAAGAANGTVTAANASVTTLPVVTLTGTGVVPTLTANPALLDFGNQTINTTAIKTYALTGTNLTGATTVAATAPYTVSKDGVTFSTSITYTAAELSATTAPLVYVQFSPTSIATLASNITNTTTGTGATVLNVPVTGIAVSAPVPTLAVSPSSLTFSATVNTTSASQTYTLTGTNITGVTTLTTSAPYSVSKDGTTWATTLTYTSTELATAKTVYVRFTPTTIGAATASSVLNATTGGSTQTVTLSGTGIGVPTLVVSPAALTFSQTVGSTQVLTYSLSGSSLTANTTVTATGAYTLSKDGTTYSTSLTYTTAELATAQTVSVKFTPVTAGAANGTVSNTSTGATTQTVTLTGTAVGLPALTVTPSALNFGYQTNGAASVLTYTLTGANLTQATTVTTAAPFTISKDNVTFSTSLSYSVAELASAKTVYVKFTPTTLVAATGTVVQASTGATSQTVTLTGTGVNSAPTLTAIADPTAICSGQTPAVIALSGITAGAESSQTTILSVTSNNPALISQIGIFSTGTTTAQINYTVASGVTGTALVTVTVKDNGGTDNGGVDTFTRTFTITVNALPVGSITSDAGTLLEKGQAFNLTATGGTSYTWTTSTDFTSSTTSASIGVRANASTTYTVTITNASGCSVTKTFAVTVIGAKKLIATNILTPNGDGKNDTWVIPNIDLYPTATVKVFDKTGKIVFTKLGYKNDWDGYYNSQPLPQGTYYYIIDIGTGTPYKGYISVIRD